MRHAATLLRIAKGEQIPVAVFYCRLEDRSLLRTLEFYAEDIRGMFQETIRHAVKESIDEVCTAKGLRALSPDEARPIARLR